MRLGSRGSDVVAWQRALYARGYAVGADDGIFGKLTHNATLAFQAREGLPATGVVGSAELRAMVIASRVVEPPLPTLPYTIPLIECRNYLRRARASVDLIVLHCMEAPEASGRAESCAAWMASERAPMASAHYFVDCDSVVQGVADHFVAYAAPGANHNGVQVEHAGYARQSRGEWLDDFGQRMLALSVQLSARLCRQWKIPATFVRAQDLRLRARGITTHHEVSLAFGKSDHHDPGPGFPIDWYCERVSALLTAEGVA